MEILTTEQLRSIIEASYPPCVSMFMPTHRQGRDTRQDPIELKNLLREAEEKLVAKGMRPTEARDMLEPARLLLDDNDFWQHNSDGLAVYVGPGFFRAYRVPLALNQFCHVNDRFDIKPLLPLLEARRFYILALSDKHVRLLECTPRTCHAIALPEDVALTLDDAIQGEKEHQTRTEHRGRNNTGNPMTGGGSFHGVADGIQDELHEDRMFYHRQIDDGVRRTIPNEKDPLIIAAAESIAPHYIHLSGYKNVLEHRIHGNPEHVSNDQLHKQGCEIMEPIWHQELNEMQDQFGSALARQLASHDLKEILPAATSGRVGILFVTTGTTHWGKVENNEVMDAEESADGAEDLIDRVAIETILTQGQVVVVEPDQMPGKGELAAIYRY